MDHTTAKDSWARGSKIKVWCCDKSACPSQYYVQSTNASKFPVMKDCCLTFMLLRSSRASLFSNVYIAKTPLAVKKLMQHSVLFLPLLVSKYLRFEVAHPWPQMNSFILRDGKSMCYIKVCDVHVEGWLITKSRQCWWGTAETNQNKENYQWNKWNISWLKEQDEATVRYPAEVIRNDSLVSGAVQETMKL